MLLRDGGATPPKWDWLHISADADELNRRPEARASLQAALDAQADPDWLPEDTRFKAQARQLLSSMK